MIKLKVLKDIYAVCKFNSSSEIPSVIYSSDFYSITKAPDELSVICKQSRFINDKQGTNKDWRIIKVIGPLDFSLIGIIAEISRILYKNKISIFSISTYETDYILVKNLNLKRALDSLESNGYEITKET